MFGHATYLIFELGWGLPVLILQWAAGARSLARQLPVLGAAVLLSTFYLSLADAYAIGHHIWTLHPGRIAGLYIGDVPVEEIIFFLLTNAIVAQSVILVRDDTVLARFRARSMLYSNKLQRFDKERERRGAVRGAEWQDKRR